MEKKIIKEILRNRELMGLLVEGPILPTITKEVVDFLTKKFGNIAQKDIGLLSNIVSRKTTSSETDLVNILSRLIKSNKEIENYLVPKIVQNLDTGSKNFISSFKEKIKNFINEKGTYEQALKNIETNLNSMSNGKPVFDTPFPEVKEYLKKDLERYAYEVYQQSLSKVNKNVESLSPVLKTREKDVFGSGIEHQIYASKSNPNVLFKVGHRDTVDEWLDVFKSNSEIFPKVFRSGKMKDKDIYYVEIEKLNTSKFENDWDDLELALEDIGALDVDRGESFTDLYINEGSDSSKFVEIGKKLSKYNKEAYNFFINFLKTIKNSERAILKVKGKDTLVDAHKYNFGYGSDGKIKCLDL